MGNSARPLITNTFVDREFLFGADAQCLVELAPHLIDVGDPTVGNGARSLIADFLVNWKLIFGTDAQRFVEISAILEEIRDPAVSDGPAATVVHVGQHCQRARICAFRILQLPQELMQVAQFQQQIHVDGT